MGRGPGSKAVHNGRLKMNEKKKIPVTYKSSGTQRYTEPIPQQTPREASPSVATASRSFVVSVPQNSSDVPPVRQESAGPNAGAPSSNDGTGAKTKTKQEINTLEQFLTYAYGRKGLRLSVKPKVLLDISPNLHIPAEGLLALQRLVNADKQFCVPRQILLAAREIEGYPAIKEALIKFVMDVMLSHPTFKNPKVASAIRNLPDAQPPHAALKLVMEEVLEKEDPEEKVGDKAEGLKAPKKAVDLEEVKVNAANCLAVWLVVTKNLSLEEVTEALNDAVWVPAGRKLVLDIAKLRALTEVEKPEGAGLACELYRRKARDHAALADRVSSEVRGLRTAITESQQLFELANNQLLEAQASLEKLQNESSEQIRALHSTTETQAAHLRDDLEQLRSRVLRRLVADVDMLDVGLSALQSPEPRIHVIQDRVERVIDALRTEINKLREE